MEFRLTDGDIDKILEIFNAKRYYFRDRTTFILPEGEIGFSVGFYKSAIEREGILVAEFHNLEDALNWLIDPEI